MWIRLLPALFAGLLAFQDVPPKPADPDSVPVGWLCPMDHDVGAKVDAHYPAQ